MKLTIATAATTLLYSSHLVNAISLDVTSTQSVKDAASMIAYDMVKYYTGNNTGDVAGNLPAPYYWWEAGAMFGSLIDYWYYTGDSTYNKITTQAMLHQVGPDNNYMPPNQSKTLGNDDQAFWGMAALSAAEVNFPNPPSTSPQWLALAQAVFNTQAPRWDTTTCGGGLRWQIFTFNNGYNYKNSISNGCFFNMGARLAKYTGNTTYSDWAEKTWTWMRSINMLDSNYYVYDGSDDTLNCTELNHIQWSYNAGAMLLGAANMYNISTGATQDKWKTRVQGLLTGIEVFFENNVMNEVACESSGLCNVDQRSFKAYLARWMAASTKMAPFIHDTVMTRLTASAKAAALQCSGGTSGRACGLRWTQGAAFDGSVGVGEQMSALEVIQSMLIDQVAGPVTNTTGGTSVGNYNAGGTNTDTISTTRTVTTADRAGAGIVTAIVLVGVIGSSWWLLV